MYKQTQWYRLLQVVYGLSLATFLIIGLTWTYEKYRPQTAPLTFEEFKATRSVSGYDVYQKMDGSWLEVILYSLGISIFITGAFLVLRKLFFYVYEGKKLYSLAVEKSNPMTFRCGTPKITEQLFESWKKEDPEEFVTATSKQFEGLKKQTLEKIEEKKFKKMFFVKAAKVFSYAFLTLLFFFFWGMRKDLGISGFLPAVIHFGIFFLLFWSVTKIKTPGIPGGEGGKDEEKTLLVEVALVTVSILILIPLLAVFFF